MIRYLSENSPPVLSLVNVNAHVNVTIDERALHPFP
jgi:hypothetical protein